jgi:hypothetical protein
LFTFFVFFSSLKKGNRTENRKIAPNLKIYDFPTENNFSDLKHQIAVRTTQKMELRTWKSKLLPSGSKKEISKKWQATII